MEKWLKGFGIQERDGKNGKRGLSIQERDREK